MTEPNETTTISSQPTRHRRTVTVSLGKLFGLLAVLLLCGLSFAAGIYYQKSHAKTTAAAAPSSSQIGGTRGGGFGGGERRNAGQVSAISSNSITITARSGSSSTFTITSTTTVTDSGQASSVSNIAVGDTVIIEPTSSGSTTAGKILLNPGFGSPAGTSQSSNQ